MKLEAAGIKVREAVNGADALTKLEAQKPDLLVLDVDMPVKDGMETLHDIRENKDLKDLKVVFLTSYGNAHDMSVDTQLAKDLGAAGYLHKTDDLENLSKSILEYLK